MKSVHDIKISVKRIDIKAGREMHERVLGDLVQKMEFSKQNVQEITQIRMWRRIMNNKLTRIAAIFMILLGASITIGVLSNQTGEQGVTFNIFFNKVAWASDETPILMWDLSNRAVGPLEDVESYELEYDGSLYVDSRERINVSGFFTNAAYRDYEYALDNRWIDKQTGQELKITPGKHKVSLSFEAVIRDGSEERRVKIESNTTEFHVLEPGQKISEEIELEAAAGGKPGKKYTSEQVKNMHYEKYGEKLSDKELAEFYLIHGMETKDVDALECALAFKQSDIDTLKLYNTLSSAYHSQLLKYSDELWSRQRKIEAIVCLRGLKYALDLDLGVLKDRSGLGFKYYTEDEEIPVGQLPAVAIKVAQDPANVLALIEQRQALISNLISMYDRKPEAHDELHELFVEYINDKDSADKFLEAIRANQEPERYPGTLFYFIQSRNRQFDKVKSYYVYDSNGLKLEGGFVPDKNEIIMGEDLYITFYVKNLGHKSFGFDRRGIYYGTDRNESFRITAIDENGQTVKDPVIKDTEWIFRGSMRRIPSGYLDYGDMYAERIRIGQWCKFERPGTYTITCSKNLGSILPDENTQVKIEVSFDLKIVPSDKNEMAKLIKSFGEQIENGNDGQAREASQILSEINDKAIIPYLVELMRKRVDWNSKNPAIDGLKQFSILDVSEGLILGLKDNDDVVRRYAAQAINDISGNDFVVAALLKELENKDQSQKELTLRALGEIGGQNALDVLKKTIENEKDQDIETRCSAAEAIGRLGDVNGVKVLEKFVEDEDYNLRLAAAKGMISLQQPVQAKWLTPVIKGTDIDKKGFETLRDSETRNIIFVETGNINEQNFHEAIRLLRVYGKEQAGPGLISCLKFDNPSVNSSYNFYLILAIEACQDVPKHSYTYQHDLNIDGSPEQIEENKKILDFYKTWLESQKIKQ